MDDLESEIRELRRTRGKYISNDRLERIKSVLQGLSSGTLLTIGSSHIGISVVKYLQTAEQYSIGDRDMLIAVFGVGFGVAAAVLAVESGVRAALAGHKADELSDRISELENTIEQRTDTDYATG